METNVGDVVQRYWEVCRGVQNRLSDVLERKGLLSTRRSRDDEMFWREVATDRCKAMLSAAREALTGGRDG